MATSSQFSSMLDPTSKVVGTDCFSIGINCTYYRNASFTLEERNLSSHIFQFQLIFFFQYKLPVSKSSIILTVGSQIFNILVKVFRRT